MYVRWADKNHLSSEVSQFLSRMLYQTNTHTGLINNQELMWRESLEDDNPTMEEEVRQGELAPIKVDARLQSALSKLVGITPVNE